MDIEVKGIRKSTAKFNGYIKFVNSQKNTNNFNPIPL